MNNQLFHITNHWALGKNRKKPQGSSLLWWQFWHKPIFATKTYFCGQKVFLPAGKKYFDSPVFTMEKKPVFSTFWQKPANPVSDE